MKDYKSTEIEYPNNINPVFVIESNKPDHFKYKTGFWDRLNMTWYVYFDDNETIGYYPSQFITHWKYI